MINDQTAPPSTPATKTSLSDAKLADIARDFAEKAHKLAFSIRRGVTRDDRSGLVVFFDNSPCQLRPARLEELEDRLGTAGAEVRACGGYNHEALEDGSPYSIAWLIDAPGQIPDATDGLVRSAVHTVFSTNGVRN